jgi:hypothetical protein
VVFDVVTTVEPIERSNFVQPLLRLRGAGTSDPNDEVGFDTTRLCRPVRLDGDPHRHGR